MDCDFFEQSYYYTQPRPQGENTSDDLSWLLYPVTIDQEPKEQVGETTDVVTKNILSPLQTDLQIDSAVQPTEHPEELQEVNSNVPEIVESISDNNIADVELPHRYELPPRSTRGIPPNRYDPEFEAQRSRYPLKENNDNLSLSQL